MIARVLLFVTTDLTNRSTKSTHDSDHRGVDLISDALPFGRLWYSEPDAVSNAKFRRRSHRAVIHVYDEAGNVIETNEHAGDHPLLFFGSGDRVISHRPTSGRL